MFCKPNKHVRIRSGHNWALISMLTLFSSFSPTAYAEYFSDLNLYDNYSLMRAHPTCNYSASGDSGTCSGSGTSADGHVSAAGAVRGYGDSLGLHAMASATESVDTAYTEYVDVYADEGLSDAIKFPNSTGGSGYMSLTLTAHGSFGGMGFGNSFLSVASDSGTLACQFHNNGSCTLTEHVIYLPTNSYSFEAQINAEVSGYAPLQGGSASGNANMENTGYISAVTFTDMNGIPLHVDFSSNSGLVYPMQPVPEPATSALVLLGVGVVGILMRRQRAPNHRELMESQLMTS